MDVELNQLYNISFNENMWKKINQILDNPEK
jgi:hypothetical protein